MATTPWELVNSVIMSPQPPWARIRRRNTVSVTPAMGARTVAGASSMGPILKLFGNIPNISLLGNANMAHEIVDPLDELLRDLVVQDFPNRQGDDHPAALAKEA